MILEVSRGHIKVKIGDRTATAQGEMFFPGNDKMGFVVYRNSMRFWDVPNQHQIMTSEDIDTVISDIQADFFRGGHTLEIEN
ncbi:Imm74 family immunity protein [Pseudomonas sp. NPDC089918]|uniref:Imm74 family immunity protein n=1 Tax=Pseudomonas sp. NPDC089918 TaxID=3390654 RepID=UPI003CFD5EF7